MFFVHAVRPNCWREPCELRNAAKHVLVTCPRVSERFSGGITASALGEGQDWNWENEVMISAGVRIGVEVRV